MGRNGSSSLCTGHSKSGVHVEKIPILALPMPLTNYVLREESLERLDILICKGG